MGASDAVVWTSLALLNLSLALLVARVRPARTAHRWVALLFASNGVNALTRAPRVLGFEPPSLDLLGALVDVPSYAALLAIPFFFPRRLLRPGGERALLGALVGYALVTSVLHVVAPEAMGIGQPLRLLLTGVPVWAAAALGVLLLADGYLGAQGVIQRDQARYVLAAYLLKLAPSLATPSPRFLDWTGPPWSGLWQLVLWGALAAVLIAVVASRLRARRGAAPTRPIGGDLFLVAFVLVGFGLRLLSDEAWLVRIGGPELAHMLLRPMLFAAGILRYQLLDVDLRAERGVVLALVASGATAALVAAERALESVGVDPGVAAAVALVTTLALGAPLVWPLVRRAMSAAGSESHGREVYRAALEEVVAAEGRGHDASQARLLSALRERLGLRPEDAAREEAAVRGALASPGVGPVVGGRFLERYRVEALLGEGGFGRAYLAHDERLGRRVVLKSSRVPSPEEERRILREARLLARIGHPSIVAIHDVVERNGESVLVLEHVESGSLADRLKQGALTVEEALRVADDVLAALEAAHAEGILHRDVKPANVLLTRDGRAKLADFGVARAAAGSGTVSGFSLAGSNPGSVRYMSPEQVRGLDLDARSDLYSVAAVLYEGLAGRPYLDFAGLADFDARLAVLENVPALPLPGVEAPLHDLLRDALAKDPANRPPSAIAMRERLKGGDARR